MLPYIKSYAKTTGRGKSLADAPRARDNKTPEAPAEFTATLRRLTATQGSSELLAAYEMVRGKVGAQALGQMIALCRDAKGVDVDSLAVDAGVFSIKSAGAVEIKPLADSEVKEYIEAHKDRLDIVANKVVEATPLVSSSGA